MSLRDPMGELGRFGALIVIVPIVLLLMALQEACADTVIWEDAGKSPWFNVRIALVKSTPEGHIATIETTPQSSPGATPGEYPLAKISALQFEPIRIEKVSVPLFSSAATPAEPTPAPAINAFSIPMAPRAQATPKPARPAPAAQASPTPKPIKLQLDFQSGFGDPVAASNVRLDPVGSYMPNSFYLSGELTNRTVAPLDAVYFDIGLYQKGQLLSADTGSARSIPAGKSGLFKELVEVPAGSTPDKVRINITKAYKP